MDKGVKLLFISAGNESCANACRSVASVEKVNTKMANRDNSDLFIVHPVQVQAVSSLKQTKPTQRGRFRNWLTTALSQTLDQQPKNQAVDQCTRRQRN
jgi:hypothetical protein